MEDHLKLRLQSLLALMEIFLRGLRDKRGRILKNGTKRGRKKDKKRTQKDKKGTKKQKNREKIIKNKIERQQKKRKRDKKVRFFRERKDENDGGKRR